MKNRFLVFLTSAVAALLLAGCSPDSYEMGAKDVAPEDLVKGIAFDIVPDTQNPNIIRFVSKMDSKYTSLYETPMGRFQGSTAQVLIPFPGDYSVTFGVMTRGGIVYGEPTTFTIQTFDEEAISDPVWALLTGGIDNEKTWYIDLDANGISRIATNAIWYFTPTITWDGVHNASGSISYMDDGWNPADAINPEMASQWIWKADWPGNQWTTGAADFGTMTFDLKGGANVSVDQSKYSLGYQGRGTFSFDDVTKSISFNDVTPLRPSNTSATVYRIIHITEDFLQIGFVDAEPSTMRVINYISKDFRDNWTPTM